MTLTTSNLKLMKAERPTGYRMSGVEIVSGEINNLFPNLATVAFAGGELEIRKAFAWVDSNNADVFRGAFLVVTKKPDNPDVSCVLFSTRDWFDSLTDHKKFLANYRSLGPRTTWIPALGGMAAGSLLIQVFGDLLTPMPTLGETYVLVQDEGGATEKRFAFKIVSLSQYVETFTDITYGRYQRRIVTIQMDAELPTTFTGAQIHYVSTVAPPTSMHTTFPSGASRVFGMMTLAAAVEAGDTLFVADSIYEQVAPASVSDTLVTSQDALGRSVAIVPALGTFVDFEYSLDFGPGVTLYLGQPAMVGTVSITAGPATLTESRGSLLSGSVAVAAVDSEHGIVTALPGAPLFTGAKTVRFRAAGVTRQPQQSASIKVTALNQSRVWSYRLPVRPAIGSIVVAYLAGGTWYELTDNGETIVGSKPEFGAASIDTLNTVSMTFGVAPDVGSRVLIFWGVDSYTFDRSGYAVNKAVFEITTTTPIGPGTLTVTWNDGISSRTATDDGHGGLTGDATGTVIYSKNKILMRPNIIPPKGTVVSTTVTPYAKAVETFDAVAVISGMAAAFTLAHTNIKPNSVRMALAGIKTNNPPAYTPVPGMLLS